MPRRLESDKISSNHALLSLVGSTHFDYAPARPYPTKRECVVVLTKPELSRSTLTLRSRLPLASPRSPGQPRTLENVDSLQGRATK